MTGVKALKKMLLQDNKKVGKTPEELHFGWEVIDISPSWGGPLKV